MIWRCRYFDGLSAARREAEVSVEPDALLIRCAGLEDVRWPFDRLRWANPPDRSGHARLAVASEPARLDIDDAELVAALRRAWPGIDRAAAKQQKHGLSAILAVGSVAAVVATVFLAATYLPSVVAPLVPASVERSIGNAVIDQIMTVVRALKGDETRFCANPKGRAAIERLVRRLVPGNEPTSGIGIRVADLSVVNAFAAPGGRILVFRGLVEFSRTPEEFAGVLAHEIGHTLHDHPIRGIVREIGLSSTLGILTGSAGGQGLAGSAANVLVRTSYSREAEREADDTAVALLTAAGINTAGMVSLFDRLAKKGADLPRAMQLFSSHPRSGDRARYVRNHANTATGPVMSKEDWKAIKLICWRKR